MCRVLVALACVLCVMAVGRAQDETKLPMVKEAETQPLLAQVKRVAEALDYLGVPLREADKAALEAAARQTDAAAATAAVQKVLDPYCLVGVELQSDKEITAAAGPAAKK